jgi:hypothetical protein
MTIDSSSKLVIFLMKIVELVFDSGKYWINMDKKSKTR